MGEVISAQLQSSLVNQAITESLLTDFLSKIAQSSPQPIPDIPEPPQPPASAQPSVSAHQLPVSSVGSHAGQSLVSAAKGLTPLSKLLAGALAATALGTGVYFATQGSLNDSEPQPTEIIHITAEPQAAEKPLTTAVPQVTASLQASAAPQATNEPEADPLPKIAYIEWSNPQFESAVRASMRIPDEPIAVAVAAAQKDLALVFSQGDISLDDLEHFPKLEILDLSAGGRTLALSPLSGLSALRELHLSNVQASDIAKLADILSLKWLSLTNTRVADPTWLSKLTSLELLHLSGVNVFDLNVLKSMTKLESLRVTHSGLSNLVPLGSMRSLKWLSVEDTNVSDLTPLADLPSLKWLNISGTEVTDLSPVLNRANPPYVVGDGGEEMEN